MIRRIIYNKDKTPKGIFIAMLDGEDAFYTGWSLCDPEDTFDERKGMIRAMERLHTDALTAPESYRKEFIAFELDAMEYLGWDIVDM